MLYPCCLQHADEHFSFPPFHPFPPLFLLFSSFSTTTSIWNQQHIDATLSGKNGGTSRGNDDRNVALEAIGYLATECNQRLKIGEKNVLVNDQKRLDTIIEILRKGLKVRDERKKKIFIYLYSSADFAWMQSCYVIFLSFWSIWPYPFWPLNFFFFFFTFMIHSKKNK